MTQQEFESYVNPNHITFETFKQSVINSSFSVNNIDSIIFQEVLSFSSSSLSFVLPPNTCAVLVLNHQARDVTSYTLNSSPTFISPCTLGTIFTTSIDPPGVPPVMDSCHTFVIFRFD